MYFDIIGDITDIETIAINRGIRDLTPQSVTSTSLPKTALQLR